ncbi:MAG: ABC transporter ATP-binding protein [Verrucomicrobia bacterium]|nr:ABC transporter ATP-binding protein [Cytophagales bacterium]
MLSVQNLVAGYQNNVLIRNLTFSIQNPAFIAVIGHNGSGKTTFFKTLTRQIPFSGEIFINNQSVAPARNLFRSGTLSLLAQKNEVNFSVSVRELVVMGRFRFKRFFDNYNNIDYQCVEDVLEKIGITHLASRDFLQLSGGEQQLVWLAQMMLQDAPLCLLDEPTQHLDIRYKRRVFDVMHRWVSDNDKTVLCITHDLSYLSDRDGFLLNFSKPDPTLEPLTHENLEKNYDFLAKN